MRSRLNGLHLSDDIFKYIFFNKNVWILIEISVKFVPNGPINNIPALADHGLVPSRWQAIIWTNDGKFIEAYMYQSASMSQHLQCHKITQECGDFFKRHHKQMKNMFEENTKRNGLIYQKANIVSTDDLATTASTNKMMLNTVKCCYNVVHYIS